MYVKLSPNGLYFDTDQFPKEVRVEVGRTYPDRGALMSRITTTYRKGKDPAVKLEDEVALRRIFLPERREKGEPPDTRDPYPFEWLRYPLTAPKVGKTTQRVTIGHLFQSRYHGSVFQWTLYTSYHYANEGSKWLFSVFKGEFKHPGMNLIAYMPLAKDYARVDERENTRFARLLV